MANLIYIPSASSLEHLQALAEVSDFASTDMGHRGQGPWIYRKLPEPLLTAELTRIANARRLSPTVDSVTFQPCPPHIAENQDRYIVQRWDLLDGVWHFAAIFDGHLNQYTVDHVQRKLPAIIKESLRSSLSTTGGLLNVGHDVSTLLRDAITSFDDSITADFLNLFSNDFVANATDQDINQKLSTAMQDHYSTMARCLGGSTVLLSLISPEMDHVWIANLGDSRAVLGTRNRSDGWSGRLVNAIQNTYEIAELRRLVSEHPGEAECIKNDKVVGFLEPTGAIGDTWLKLPAVYTRRVFSRFNQDWISPERFSEYADRLLSPPYVSNTPDIYHRILPLESPAFLILSSDGLTEFYDMSSGDMAMHWAELIGNLIDLGSESQGNKALCLLRNALGGDDVDRVSQYLTVEMDERWVDDTTIIIQSFHINHI